MKKFLIITLLAFVSCFFMTNNMQEEQKENVKDSEEVIVTPTPEVTPTYAEPEIEEEPKEEQKEEPKDEELVKILDYIPDVVIDLKYATEENFTGVVIYESDEALLRYGTVKKLKKVQEELKKLGYKLCIWDAFRPKEAQFKLWEICPNPIYVANPNKGFSKHSRGNTVDITIVSLSGEKVEMPSEFDDFTKKADRDYSDVSKEAGENAKMLEKVMEEAGFKGYAGEWWHYSDEKEYSVFSQD